MPRSRPPSRRVRIVLAIVLGVLLAGSAVGAAVGTAVASGSSGGTGDGQATVETRQPADCDVADGSDRLNALATRYDYADGLANASAADWTGGTVLRIGAHGDCSLAVANGSAALTATRANGTVGVVHATVDVGRGGALRLVAAPDTNGTATAAPDGSTARPTVAVENVGRANDARVAVVARNASGETYRRNLTAPSGRFLDVAVYWYRNGTVAVALRDPAESSVDPAAWDARFATPARSATWGLRLDGRAYLDEVAVGRHDPVVDDTSDADGDTGGTDSDGFEAPDGDDEEGPATGAADYGGADQPGGESDDGAAGVVLGPIVAGVGAGIYRYAYELTRFNEQIDAIGSKTRSSEVEPAGWNVALTKLFGAGVALGGGAWFLLGLGTALG